jgi:hypothetical protein
MRIGLVESTTNITKAKNPSLRGTTIGHRSEPLGGSLAVLQV